MTSVKPVQWTFIYSFVIFTFYRYITNSQSGQLPDSSVGTAPVSQVKSLNPVQAKNFLRLQFHNCLSCMHDCDNKPCLHNIINILHHTIGGQTSKYKKKLKRKLKYKAIKSFTLVLLMVQTVFVTEVRALFLPPAVKDNLLFLKYGSTLCPLRLSSGNIRSRRSILPQLVTSSSSTLRSKVSCSTGHSIRYGWLQHFLNCIMILVIRTDTTVVGALVQVATFLQSNTYHHHPWSLSPVKKKI